MLAVILDSFTLENSDIVSIYSAEAISEVEDFT